MDDLQLELSFSGDSGPNDPQSSDESGDYIDESVMYLEGAITDLLCPTTG